MTPVFELKGDKPANVEIYTNTGLANNWAYFSYALINEETGQAYDFGRELSYYFGADSDGSWTEGSTSDTVTLPSIPAGDTICVSSRRSRRVCSRWAIASGCGAMCRASDILGWFSFLLLIPPAFTTFRRIGFETQRWAESDYAPVSSSSGDDD